ncbi:MAG: 6-phosphogluconolactonase [Gemmatimonadota bacterium]
MPGGRKSEPVTLVFEDPAALHAAAAERIAREGKRAVFERGRFLLILTGGSTVKPVYERLAEEPWRSEIAWDALDVFFTDERCVPPDHPDSNFGMASAALLDRVPVPCERIHRMRGEDPNHERSAIAYEHRIRTALDLARGEPPHFDLILLGLGPDAHVASLFPGDPQASVEDRLVIAVEHAVDPPPRVDRISLTAPALNGGRATLFVASGGGKAAAVKAVLEGPPDPERYPAQRIDPLLAPPVWLLDGPAAGDLAR